MTDGGASEPPSPPFRDRPPMNEQCSLTTERNRDMTYLSSSASAVHHHGAQDTVVYAVTGRGSVVSEGGRKKVDLEPGDYALIPAYMEHQEVNDGGEDVVWAIIRSGRMPEVVNLTGWGGEPAKQ